MSVLHTILHPKQEGVSPMPRQTKPSSYSLRHLLGVSLALSLFVFLLPVLTVRGEAVLTPKWDTTPPTSPNESSAIPTSARDRGRVVKLLLPDGTISELSMEEYLLGVVSAEMPASFELEALKAQACAARTYTVRKQTYETAKHPDADVCTDISCCQAYLSPSDAAQRWGSSAESYTQKIQQAVAETDGLGVLYNGSPIQAVFFSSAPGYTVDAVEVWGNQVDYLQSVESPEGDEVPNFRSTVTLSADEVKSLILNTYANANLTGDPSTWFGSPVTNQGGTVSSILVGGVTLTGNQIRSLFQLRSACFLVSWDGTSFTFSVTGYGHGVGMSQYGANTMAQSGSTYDEILTWYYTNTQVDFLW